MLELAATKPSELEKGLTLMRTNMSATLEARGVPWDDDWNRKHYSSLDNYSVFLRDQWIGFISIEEIQDTLFVHTLQLSPEYQGNVYGIKLFQWLCAQALGSDKNFIRCRAIEGSSVVELYSRLGFAVEGTSGVLVSLALSLDKIKPMSALR
ncbi:MAG: GNAT family N-acetyltransferase [Halioglobus sp.]